MPLTLCPDPDSWPCCFHLFWESLVHSLEISTDVTCWWESFISLPVYMYYHYSCLTVYSLLSLVLMLADGTQSFYHQLWCCKLLCFYVCIISFIKFTFSPICWGPLSWTDIVICCMAFLYQYVHVVFLWLIYSVFLTYEWGRDCWWCYLHLDFLTLEIWTGFHTEECFMGKTVLCLRLYMLLALSSSSPLGQSLDSIKCLPGATSPCWKVMICFWEIHWSKFIICWGCKCKV